MKYEHTVVLTAELTGFFDEDHTEDLSERFTSAVGIILGLMSIHVNILRCQDFIREKNVEEDLGDWIRFDPADRLTWPMVDDLRGFSVPVITCSDDNSIHIGYIMHFDEDAEAESTWELSNSAEDVSLPLDSVIAWQPLPKPFHMEQNKEE